MGATHPQFLPTTGLRLVAWSCGRPVPTQGQRPKHPSSSCPQTYEQHEWVIHLAGRLLANDAEVLSLLAFNPFADKAPPR